jgi:hypothetical protein
VTCCVSDFRYSPPAVVLVIQLTETLGADDVA